MKTNTYFFSGCLVSFFLLFFISCSKDNDSIEKTDSLASNCELQNLTLSQIQENLQGEWYLAGISTDITKLKPEYTLETSPTRIKFEGNRYTELQVNISKVIPETKPIILEKRKATRKDSLYCFYPEGQNENLKILLEINSNQLVLKTNFISKNLFYIYERIPINKPNEGKPQIPTSFKTVTVLEIDLQTNTFMGGYSIPLGQACDSFKIDAYYKAPGDFGNIAFYEKTTEEKLFYGTIIWDGKGEQIFPKTIQPASSYKVISTSTSLPERYIAGWEDPYNYPDTSVKIKKYAENAWNAIQHLEIVSDSRTNHPEQPVYYYLYTRSVGVGEPAEWYWLIFLCH